MGKLFSFGSLPEIVETGLFILYYPKSGVSTGFNVTLHLQLKNSTTSYKFCMSGVMWVLYGTVEVASGRQGSVHFHLKSS